MHKNVEVLIGRLATDPALQRRFAKQPLPVLLEQGLELSEVEIAALIATDLQALRAFTAALDSRLRKISRSSQCESSNGATSAESPRDSEKETAR